MPTVKDIIIRKPSAEEISTAQKWPIWECGVSEFEWDYTQTETCYILQGQVIIKDRIAGTQVSFTAGDLVIFPNDLSCIWQVKTPVRKHYKFD